jgi:hypothetical protein
VRFLDSLASIIWPISPLAQHLVERLHETPNRLDLTVYPADRSLVFQRMPGGGAHDYMDMKMIVRGRVVSAHSPWYGEVAFNRREQAHLRGAIAEWVRSHQDRPNKIFAVNFEDDAEFA